MNVSIRSDGMIGETPTVALSRNPSAVSDAPHSKGAGEPRKSGGARPIQRFEGSRPWGGLCILNGIGLMNRGFGNRY